MCSAGWKSAACETVSFAHTTEMMTLIPIYFVNGKLYALRMEYIYVSWIGSLKQVLVLSKRLLIRTFDLIWTFSFNFFTNFAQQIFPERLKIDF